jgi:hypothetical protein
MWLNGQDEFPEANEEIEFRYSEPISFLKKNIFIVFQIKRMKKLKKICRNCEKNRRRPSQS